MEGNGTTGKELARICDVAASAVTKWKKGGNIGNDKLKRISVHFGVSTDWLLGLDKESSGKPIMPAIDKKSLTLAKRIEKLSDVERKAIEGMLKAMGK